MTYVITFDNGDDGYESYTASANYIDLAIMDAKDQASERHGPNYYTESDILSIIRI